MQQSSWVSSPTPSASGRKRSLVCGNPKEAQPHKRAARKSENGEECRQMLNNEQTHPVDSSLRRSNGLFGAVAMSLITWV
jgi:hypothetical protein